jgi:hypothetical protein
MGLKEPRPTREQDSSFRIRSQALRESMESVAFAGFAYVGITRRTI